VRNSNRSTGRSDERLDQASRHTEISLPHPAIVHLHLGLTLIELGRRFAQEVGIRDALAASFGAVSLDISDSLCRRESAGPG
jgi:hypothetical protein